MPLPGKCGRRRAVLRSRDKRPKSLGENLSPPGLGARWPWNPGCLSPPDPSHSPPPPQGATSTRKQQRNPGPWVSIPVTPGHSRTIRDHPFQRCTAFFSQCSDIHGVSTEKGWGSREGTSKRGRRGWARQRPPTPGSSCSAQPGLGVLGSPTRGRTYQTELQILPFSTLGKVTDTQIRMFGVLLIQKSREAP